jgi:hypothetical protein
MQSDLQLGDLLIIGGQPAAKLLKAFAVIADQLHPGFDRQPNLKPFVSRGSCVLCALTVRDFLVRVGFHARVRSVCTVLWAHKDGKLLHSAAIGAPHDKRKMINRWTGHMVTTVDDWLIDPTLYQVRRSAWPDLAGMMALPLHPRPWQRSYWGLDLIASAAVADEEFMIGWFDNPKNTAWKFGPDARDPMRRAPVTVAMIERFGRWEEDAA